MSNSSYSSSGEVSQINQSSGNASYYTDLETSKIRDDEKQKKLLTLRKSQSSKDFWISQRRRAVWDGFGEHEK